MKQVKFRRPDDGTEVRKSRGRLNLIQKLDGFSFMKSKENVFREETPSTSSESDVELADDWVLSYEPVEKVILTWNIFSKLQNFFYYRIVSTIHFDSTSCWIKNESDKNI